MASRGRGSKAKGHKFELDVRNELKRIYPPERRERLQRVPMSGAGWMKADVIDQNDTEWTYEAKKQEKLCLPQWWKQTKAQAQAFQEPVLIFSSNHRPMYWCVLAEQWDAYALQAGLPATFQQGNTRGLYDKLSKLEPRECLVVELDGDKVAIIQNDAWLAVRRRLWEQR